MADEDWWQKSGLMPSETLDDALTAWDAQARHSSGSPRVVALAFLHSDFRSLEDDDDRHAWLDAE